MAGGSLKIHLSTEVASLCLQLDLPDHLWSLDLAAFEWEVSTNSSYCTKNIPSLCPEGRNPWIVLVGGAPRWSELWGFPTGCPYLQQGEGDRRTLVGFAGDKIWLGEQLGNTVPSLGLPISGEAGEEVALGDLAAAFQHLGEELEKMQPCRRVLLQTKLPQRGSGKRDSRTGGHWGNAGPAPARVCWGRGQEQPRLVAEALPDSRAEREAVLEPQVRAALCSPGGCSTCITGRQCAAIST